MKKIAIAITGASGSIYAKLLLQKLQNISEQITELSIALSDNAKYVWQTELGDENYSDFPGRYFSTKDFRAPFASGSAGYDALIIIIVYLNPEMVNNTNATLVDPARLSVMALLSADLTGLIVWQMIKKSKTEYAIVYKDDQPSLDEFSF